jgi:hypothetical protein
VSKFLWSVIVALGTLVGLATGLGTIIGALASSESFWDTALLCIRIGGAVFGIGVFATGLVLSLFTKSVSKTWRGRVGFSAFYGFWTFAIAVMAAPPWGDADLREAGFSNDKTWLLVLGSIAIATFALATAWMAVNRIRAQARARKQCPDCAETVKATANVCRYCGFRFAARPSRPPWPTG